jgi:hypothetical protein
MRKRVHIVLAGLLAALFILILSLALHGPGRLLSPRVVRLADGRVLKLERYEFQANTVRYELPNRPLVRVIEKVLPGSIAQRIKWPQKPERTVICSPDFRGEPFLSIAVSAQHGSFAGRWAVSDDQGQFFDPVVNDRMFEVLRVTAFPRRGKELHLHFMEYPNASVAEFRISNPCPGPHPKWKAQPVPMTSKVDGFEFTLEKFMADRARARTECGFLVRVNGRDTLAWRPVSLEVADATGNHWRPELDPRQESTDGNQILIGFYGALWPEEDAWWLRVKFKNVDQVPEDVLRPVVQDRVAEFLAKPEQTSADSEPSPKPSPPR